MTHPIVIHPQNALVSFASLLASISQTPYKLYLLIDEYDNFANEVLMSKAREGQQRYEEIVKGEGFLKTIFKLIKSATSGQGLERVFITGVSPLVVSDMPSGYNVAEDIYLLPKFADLCGFHEAEVVAMIAQMAEACQFSAEKQAELLQTMRIFYDGYRFSPRRQERIYNPTLTFYFLKAGTPTKRALDGVAACQMSLNELRGLARGGGSVTRGAYPATNLSTSFASRLSK